MTSRWRPLRRSDVNRISKTWLGLPPKPSPNGGECGSVHPRHQHPSTAFTGSEPLSSRVLIRPPAELAIAVISVRESLDGWYSQITKAKSPAQIELVYQSMIDAVRLLSRFPIHNFTQPAVVRFESLLRQKLNVGENDLRIAAVALEHGATVVTANVRDFSRVPNLSVEDWTR